MKNSKPLLILIPVVSAILALNGLGMFFRTGVAASCILILIVAYGRKINKGVWIFIAALLFLIIGDWFLSHRRGIPIRFIYGILFFFIAHIGILWFSLRNGKINLRLLAITLFIYLIFFFLILLPNIDDSLLLVAVLGYLLISCTSFAAAYGVQFLGYLRWLFFMGVAALLFSNTIIALREFAGNKELSFLIMPTYYLSHILMTLSLLGRANNSTDVT